MGDTIWVDVEGRAKSDVPSDNSIMLRLDKELEKIAEKLGVSKLTSFYDYSVMADAFGDFGEGGEEDEDEEGEGDGAGAGGADGGEPGGTWFDPSDALAAVRAIRQHLLQQPNDLGFKPDASRSHWPADLMKELECVQGVLEDAATRSRKFRFLIVP
jgi:hypothetical protein